MQYLNDDMDELFRRAAKDYPLNTSSANWDKVKAALENTPAEAMTAGDRNNKRHLLWLLLLLPFGLICNRMERGQGEMVTHPSTNQRSGTVPDLPPGALANKSVAGERGMERALSLNNGTTAYSGTTTYASGTGTTARAGNQPARPGNDGARTQVPERTTVDQNSDRQTLIPDRPNTDLSSELSEVSEPINSDGAITQETKEKEAGEQEEPGAPAPKARARQSREKRFYIGALGGLDVTSVKLQEVKRVGYDVGLLAGYELSQKWSVEAGLLSSERTYYSKGQYLGKAQAYMPYGSKIIDAEGDCRMLEVPILIRYQVAKGKKGSWFASGGVTSYFMKRENYDYTVWEQSTGQEVVRSREYYKNSSHLGAAVQLSGGYQLQMGKNGALRLEPYLRIPVRKVGIYELPLTSGGIHMGITRKLF